ncbi:MAG: O-antigen ligase family protein [Terriglobales bacterium]
MSTLPATVSGLTACLMLAVLAGVLAATGAAAAMVILLGVGVLVWTGARLSWMDVQTILLAALLFVPDIASGKTFDLRITWSHGLTWSNFVVPALALPLLAGAWWSGRLLLPERWPGLACGLLALLAWLLLSLGAALVAGDAILTRTGGLTVLAHAAKLALFVLLGVALSTGGTAWRQRAERLLLGGIAINAAAGLAQAAGWIASLSPLAQSLPPRATGLFYDANLYGVVSAWALLWLLCQPLPHGWRGWAGTALTVAVAGSLLAAGSRAGYLACAAGCVVLACAGRRRAVARAAVLLTALALVFPARSWQRIHAAALTVDVLIQPSSTSVPAPDASTRQRLATMHQALRQIARHPWLGLGFGRALYLGVPGIGSGPLVPTKPFRGAQNMFLTVAAAGGMVGLALLLLAVAAPLRLPDRARRWAVAPVLAGYAGVLTACLTQEALWNARLLALVVLLTAGIGVGWRRA